MMKREKIERRWGNGKIMATSTSYLYDTPDESRQTEREAEIPTTSGTAEAQRQRDLYSILDFGVVKRDNFLPRTFSLSLSRAYLG